MGKIIVLPSIPFYTPHSLPGPWADKSELDGCLGHSHTLTYGAPS